MAIEVQRHGVTIGVGKLPGRKSERLYYVDPAEPGVIVTVAYFRSEMDSNRFLDMLVRACGIRMEELVQAQSDKLTAEWSDRGPGPTQQAS